MDFQKLLLLVDDPEDMLQYLSFPKNFSGSAGNKALIEIVVRFMSSKEVVKKALFVMLQLFVSGEGIDLGAFVESNAMDAIVIDMHFHAADQKIQERGLRVFAYAAPQDPEISTALLNCGALEHICTVFRSFTKNRNVCKFGLSALCGILTNGKDVRDRICAVDLVDSIALVVSSFHSDAEILSSAFSALYVIAGVVNTYADAMMSAGLGRKAFDAMKAFAATPALVHPALVLVSRLSRGDTAAAQFPKWCDMDALLRVARTYDDFREDSLVTLAAAATLDPSGRLLQNGGVEYLFGVVEEWSRTSRGRVPKGLKAISLLTDSARYAKTVCRNSAWLGFLTRVLESVSDAETLNTLATIMCNISFNDHGAQLAMFRCQTTGAIIRAAGAAPTAEAKSFMLAALGNACGDCVESRAAAATGGGLEVIEQAYALQPPAKEVHESAARALEIIFSTDEVRARCLKPGLMEKVEASHRLFPHSQMIANCLRSLGRKCDLQVSCAAKSGVCTSALVPRCSAPCPARKGCYCPACCAPQATFFCVTCFEETGEVVRLCQSCVDHHDGDHTFIRSFVSRRCNCDLTECKMQKKKARITYNNNSF